MKFGTVFKPLFFFLILSSLALTILPLQLANADYDCYQLTDFADNWDDTYVYDDYLYIGNASYVYEYLVTDPTDNQSLYLGAGITINEVYGRFDQLYLNVTDTGVHENWVINLESFVKDSEVLQSSLTNWNGELRNLCYIDVSGTDYWGYGYSHGVQDDPDWINDSYETVYRWSSDRQSKYFVTHSRGFQQDSASNLEVRFYIYLWNGTHLNGYYEELVDVGAKREIAYYGVYEYDGTLKASNDENFYSSDGWEIEQDSGNIQSHLNDLVFDARELFEPAYTGYYDAENNTFYTAWGSGDRCIYTSLTDGNEEISSDRSLYYIDIYSRLIQFDSSDIDGIRTTTFGYTGAYSSAWVSSDLTANTNIANQKIGLAGIGYYWHDEISQLPYIGYITDSDRPRVDVMYGSINYNVGQLPVTYTPADARIFVGSQNLYAVFTEAGDDDLFVCPNLIEGDELYYGTTTAQILQLYRCYDTSTTDNFRVSVRVMRDASGYPVLAGEQVHLYIDDSYFNSYTTDSNGLFTSVYSASSYPTEYQIQSNITGYSERWLNITFQGYDTFYANCNVLEQPQLAVEMISDNTDTNNLRVRLTATRYTGEEFDNQWFNRYPRVNYTLYTYSSGILEDSYNYDGIPVNDEGWFELILAYSTSLSYIMTLNYYPLTQGHPIGNFTTSNSVAFGYDGMTHEFLEGNQTTIRDTIVGYDYWEDEPVNPDDLSGWLTIWTENTGFVFMMGIIGAIVIGMAKVNPSSAIIGIVVLCGLLLGFGGYTGLLPLPIFIVSVIALVLIVSLIFTKAFGSDRR